MSGFNTIDEVYDAINASFRATVTGMTAEDVEDIVSGSDWISGGDRADAISGGARY